MPVLSEHHNPAANMRQATTNSTSTSSAYLLISLAILLTLGISISRRKRSRSACATNNSFFGKRKTSNAGMMQEPTPPTSASALPEKPYLPNPDTMEHQQATSDHEETGQQGQQEQQQQFYTPQFQQPQQFQSHENQHTTVILQAKPHQPPPFQTRLGSLPAVTTSLLHPEPPSPTISMSVAAPDSMKVQTHITHQNMYEGQNQNQFQPQPQGQYTQNEILFVPSPTEYTSFEALYSRFPPPIYDGPNPASYASTTFSPPDSQDSSVPRRRSYTKTLSNGSEVSGEITEMGGQWRRHTRVFGGGVCVACEESESRRMSA